MVGIRGGAVEEGTREAPQGEKDGRGRRGGARGGRGALPEPGCFRGDRKPQCSLVSAERACRGSLGLQVFQIPRLQTGVWPGLPSLGRVLHGLRLLLELWKADRCRRQAQFL